MYGMVRRTIYVADGIKGQPGSNGKFGKPRIQYRKHRVMAYDHKDKRMFLIKNEPVHLSESYSINGKHEFKESLVSIASGEDISIFSMYNAVVKLGANHLGDSGEHIKFYFIPGGSNEMDVLLRGLGLTENTPESVKQEILTKNGFVAFGPDGDML